MRVLKDNNVWLRWKHSLILAYLNSVVLMKLFVKKVPVFFMVYEKWLQILYFQSSSVILSGRKFFLTSFSQVKVPYFTFCKLFSQVPFVLASGSKYVYGILWPWSRTLKWCHFLWIQFLLQMVRASRVSRCVSCISIESNEFWNVLNLSINCDLRYD